MAKKGFPDPRKKTSMWALLVVSLALVAVLVRSLRARESWPVQFALAIARQYSILWHRWRSHGKIPLPATGPAIVVSNHTCSADPMFLLAGSDRMISFLVAREHYHLNAPIHWLLRAMSSVPVARDGQDAGAVRCSLRRLAEGRVIGIFPEGNLSGVARNRIRPGKAGAALIALRSRVPVYPAYIAGGPRTRKLLSAWLRPSKVPVRVVFGPPVDLSAYYGRPINRRLLEEVMAFLMEHVKALRPSTPKKS
jgi:1-acyl-sn-glycerol-3-phosphate acyltransferase